MDKNEIADILKASHLALEAVIQPLSGQQISTLVVIGGWTGRDVIAHVMFWNEDYLLEIDRALADQATWHKLDEQGGLDSVNERAVAERRDIPLPDLLARWRASSQALVARVESLTPAEWDHQSGNDRYGNGYPVTVSSLFFYEKKVGGHEAEHAAHIKEALSR